jgi:hypothetical protein
MATRKKVSSMPASADAALPPASGALVKKVVPGA